MPRLKTPMPACGLHLLVPVAALLVLLAGGDRPAYGYIDIPAPSLAKLCANTPAIAVLRVEKVSREKRGIVFSKVRDLKGTFPTQGKYFGDAFTHILRKDSALYSPQDKDHQAELTEAVLAWAVEGKTAVVFQRGGEQAICVGHSWYTARPALAINSDLRTFAPERPPPAREPWVYGGVCDSRFAGLFCGDVEDLVAAVTDLLAGKEATVTRMRGTAKMVSDRAGPIQRFRADQEGIPDRSRWVVEREAGSGSVIARPPEEFDNPFAGQAPWSSHRGNVQRTGSDGGAGPKIPKILWAYKSDDHFIAPLLPGAKSLYASSLGPFNTPSLRAFALDPLGDKQVRWTKGAPLLRQPIAGSPAFLEGKAESLVFGDGFHTSDGSSLRCIRGSDGFPLWQLAGAGDLVHFEGTPTIANGKLYVGGGNAGVLCIDPNRVIVEGKEHDLPSAQAIQEKRWQDLRAKYEVEKKKDPEFALPPDETMLPRSTPTRLWQAGQDKWHVDAPVAVVDDRVLATSAYLDDDKAGESALVCLKTSDGSILWKTPLKVNPWAGPTVGPYVLVGCSSIRLDPKGVAGAKGEVLAIELDSGKIKWRKDVPGGVLSSVAVKAGMAILTATDGKVRAWDAFTGGERWVYDAKTPFFAGPAVAQNMVYAADLKGVVHALNLIDGKKEWTLDLSADPALKTAGMVYGAPIVQGGRLFLATCNMGTREAGPNVVVCIGAK